MLPRKESRSSPAHGINNSNTVILLFDFWFLFGINAKIFLFQMWRIHVSHAPVQTRALTVHRAAQDLHARTAAVRQIMIYISFVLDLLH